jgi:hypothetical protein
MVNIEEFNPNKRNVLNKLQQKIRLNNFCPVTKISFSTPLYDSINAKTNVCNKLFDRDLNYKLKKTREHIILSTLSVKPIGKSRHTASNSIFTAMCIIGELQSGEVSVLSGKLVLKLTL